MKTSRRNRGLSLVEVLVAAGLLSLILLVSAQVFVPSIRAWRRQQKQTESTQNSLVAINWLESDLSLSKPTSVSFENNTTLRLIKSQPQPEPGQSPFRIRVTYILAEGTLYRSQQEFDPETQEVLPEVPGLPIANSVEKFLVRTPQAWITDIEFKTNMGGQVNEIQTAITSVYAPFDAALEQKPSTSP